MSATYYLPVLSKEVITTLGDALKASRMMQATLPLTWKGAAQSDVRVYRTPEEAINATLVEHTSTAISGIQLVTLKIMGDDRKFIHTQSYRTNPTMQERLAPLLTTPEDKQYNGLKSLFTSRVEVETLDVAPSRLSYQSVLQWTPQGGLKDALAIEPERKDASGVVTKFSPQ